MKLYRNNWAKKNPEKQKLMVKKWRRENKSKISKYDLFRGTDIKKDDFW